MTSFVLTLIAAVPGELTARPLANATTALTAAGATVAEPVWLADGWAADLPFTGAAPADVIGAVRIALAGAQIDAIAQAAAGRRKRLLVADMDSTIIAQESLDEMADLLGLKDKIAAITAKAMNGQLDFAAAVRERVGLLAGLDRSAIAKTLDRLTIQPGAHCLVATMRAHGAHCVLATGGFGDFAAPIAERCGFDVVQANTLHWDGDKLAGTVGEPILGKDAKATRLHQEAAQLGCSAADAVAIGDGANDLAMLAIAGLGLAVHAKPVVALEAPHRIETGTLHAVLFAQGYATRDFSSLPEDGVPT